MSLENHSLMEKDHLLLQKSEAADQTAKILEKISSMVAVNLKAPLFSENYAAQYVLQLAQLSKERRELNQALALKEVPTRKLAQTDHPSQEEDIFKSACSSWIKAPRRKTWAQNGFRIFKRVPSG